MMGCVYGVEPSYRVSDRQGVAWTHGGSPFDMSVHAAEYSIRDAINDVAYHRTRFVSSSIVSSDKSGDAFNDIKAGKVI